MDERGIIREPRTTNHHSIDLLHGHDRVEVLDPHPRLDLRDNGDVLVRETVHGLPFGRSIR